MAVFASASEVDDAIGGMFREALHTVPIGDDLAASGVVLQLRLRKPDVVLTIDMPNRAVYTGDDGPDPTMVLKADTDVAHEYWLGEVNVGVAITRGRIRVKGSVPTLIRLAGLLKPLFPIYRERMSAA